MQAFEELLAAIGFPAADAAGRIARTERDLGRGRAEVLRSGEVERTGIDLDAEARGVHLSGSRYKALADQRGMEATRLADLEIAAADDIAAANQEIMRAIAEEQARDEARAAERDVAGKEYDVAMELLRGGHDSELASIRRNYEIDARAIAGGGVTPGVPDLAGIDELIRSLRGGSGPGKLIGRGW